MTDSVELNDVDTAVSEIELDAFELRRPAPLAQSDLPPAAQISPAAGKQAKSPKQTAATSARSMPILRIAGVVGIALGLAAASFYYMYSPPKGPVQQSAVAWPRLVSLNSADDSQAPSEPSSPPVRVKNPFDASEVFEFPAGTSKVEAREAVAAMLMARARERQALVSIEHAKSNHSAGR